MLTARANIKGLPASHRSIAALARGIASRLLAILGVCVSAGFVLALSTCAIAHASGCTDSWEKAESGSWGVATNWSTHKVPASSDEVCITVPGAYTVTLTGSVSVNSLTLGVTSGSAKQTLLVGGPLSATATLSLAASSTINQAGLLDMESGVGASSLVQAPSTATVANEGEVLTSASSVNHLEANLTNAAGATVEVKSGELRQDANTTTTNEGIFQVDSGASFGATTSKDLFVNKGSLANGGSISSRATPRGRRKRARRPRRAVRSSSTTAARSPM